MKKFTLILFSTLCICWSLSNQVQAQEYEVGTKVVNLGIGLGGTGSLGFGSLGFGASGEVGVRETGDFGVIGAGLFVGYRSGSYGGVFLSDDFKESTFTIAPRATYHFTVIDVEKLDVYAAVQIGLGFRTTTFPGIEDDNDFIVNPALIAGARYYFNDTMAGFAELGINGGSLISIGLAFRF